VLKVEYCEKSGDMDIGETRKDYQKLGVMLRKVLSMQSATPPSEMDQILELANKMGHPLLKDVQEMKEVFDQMRKKPREAQLADRFLKLALRLEQETREI
jgi:hypothetical protein